MATVELVYDTDCPNVVDAREQLRRAFAAAKVDGSWIEWRGDDAASPARVRGFASPTILVDGVDVVATAPSEGAACRLYQRDDGSVSGVPSVEAISSALRAAASTTGAGAAKAGWKLNLAMLPGVGAALLPNLACPACWPAYAGLLSSVGLGFLLDATYLLWFTAAALAFAVGALAFRAQRRRGYRPFFVGLVAAGTVLVGKFGFESDIAMYVGLALLIGASVWNSWPRSAASPTATCAACGPTSGSQGFAAKEAT